MSDKQTIIKLVHACNTDASISTEIGRITGLIDAEAFFKLMPFLEIESNPRKPKESKVTKDITETLISNSKLFHFMSKGILVSASSCMSMDRNRFKLTFDSNEYATPGLLDGGHNTFAIAKFLLSFVTDEDTQKSIKDWDSMKTVWTSHTVDLENLFADFKIPNSNDESLGFNFLIPIELIHPKNANDIEIMEKWGQSHSDITHSRNNNVQLTDSTKDNHLGLYDYLKSLLPKDLNERIEWRTNDRGVIKASDIVALALIPISKLPIEITGEVISSVKIYNSKQYCVETYRKIMEYGSNSSRKGETYTLVNDSLKSALDLVPTILELYDLIYCDFPEAYNKSSGSFGRIDGVRIYDENITSESNKSNKYSKKQFTTTYFGLECKYKYPDGFIIPLVVGLSELIFYDEKSKKLTFTTDPKKFIKEKLNDILIRYSTLIRMSKYDSQKIGKDSGSYIIARDAIRSV